MSCIVALTPYNRTAIKNQINQPRNRAGTEDDILVFHRYRQEGLLILRGKIGGVYWRGVILFLKVTIAWAWEQCNPGLQDLLCETREGSVATQMCCDPPSSPNPPGSSKQTALKRASPSSAATVSHPTKQDRDTSHTCCLAAEARSFLHSSETITHQLDPHSLMSRQHTPASKCCRQLQNPCYSSLKYTTVFLNVHPLPCTQLSSSSQVIKTSWILK